MTLEENRQQIIQQIMDTLEARVECDQLVNKLADAKIISTSDVTKITDTEEKDRVKTLVDVIMEKDDENLHPLALKILESQTLPDPESTRNTKQALERAVQGVDPTSAPTRPAKERRILKHSDLSDDWEVKNFLVELSEGIGEDEMKKMKYIMRGENGFGDAVIEKITDPLKFFEILRKTRRIDAYNLHFLQALIWRTKRRDLTEKIRQFCLECDKKPIHFILPAEQPENGYKYIKFHVEGDIDELTHADKEHLRADVARILCVPITTVFIRGLEPAKSLLFTFMVPKEDVNSFIHIYMCQEVSFVHLSVHVEIHDAELSLSEIAPTTEHEHKPMYRELKHMLEREQSLKTHLADRDEQLIDLQDKLDRKEEDSTVDQILRNGGELNAQQLNQKYRDLFHRAMSVMKTMKPREDVPDSNGKFGSLKLSSASALYRRLLSQVRERCSSLDIDLLNKLLDAKTTLEATLHEERLRRMQDIIMMLSEQVEEQAEMNTNLQAFSNIAGASSPFLQDILAIQEQTSNLAIKQDQQGKTHKLEIIGMQVVNMIHPAPQQILLHPYASILMTMSKELSNEERQKLKTFLCFSEVEEELLKKYPDRFLEHALLRELLKGRQEDPMEIVGEILAKIGKRGLVQQYLDPE
ncbi:uncharacterized protein LOC124269204 isoform X2 [Haliotis rubra]|uniref:uncharacterized protein LOC124269204 isoform X2 n=1 Tax=Haliotis rubra TaxID=36100 RepID=UPI001EE5CB78|nr:uncharacterized protein LOC124269204 isoform X2 [Haliotis rubra]